MTNLHLTEEDYRNLFQLASDAIWVHDLKGNITAGNKAFEKMTGHTMDKLLCKNVREFLSKNALTLAGIVKSKLLKDGPASERYEQRLLRGDGRSVIVEITTYLITQDGQPVAFQNIARDITQEREIRDNLQFYLRKVLVAQEEERKRIACDLHDDTMQSLLLLIHRLDGIASKSAEELPRPVYEELAYLRTLVLEILTGLRRCAEGLRPVILDDLGLVASLEWMADSLTAENKIDVSVQLNLRKRKLPRDVQLILFRIAQEAIGNIKKHAGALRVVIRLETAANGVRLTVTDNGKGFEVPELLSDLGDVGTLGLIGMQERAKLLDGKLSISSQPGQGTTLVVEIPQNKHHIII